MRRGFLAESPQKAIFTGCYVCIFQTDCCRRQELRRGADTTGMKHEPQSAEWSQAATQPCKESVRSPDVPRRDIYEGAVLTTRAQRRRRSLNVDVSELQRRLHPNRRRES